jgi:acyl dehydratase
MAVEQLRSGDRSGPYDLVLSGAMAAALARATRDDTPQYIDGTALPPTAIATQTYAAQLAAILELVPEPVFAAARGGVHGRHDLLLHRAIAPGEELQTLVELHSAKRSKDNLRVTLLHRTSDAGGALVAEQWWTTVLLGASGNETGPDLPARGGTDWNEQEVVAEEVIAIDIDMARLYAEVSGDFSDHHFDAEAARRSGFAGPFLHGLCTMALCARAVVRTVGADDPSRLQRLAVQFAAPAYVGQDLAVRVSRLGGDQLAFEATSGDAVTIRNGFAQLRATA